MKTPYELMQEIQECKEEISMQQNRMREQTEKLVSVLVTDRAFHCLNVNFSRVRRYYQEKG
ncbi:MAG: hypothetical protein KAJ10_07285 [Thermodesulfovibrionia bacterium]|nr:hypothetical protein [Thermodesulfovibrionia bacterium]